MVDSPATEIALLKSKFTQMEKDFAEETAACKKRDDDNTKRIKVLEEYKAKADKYGWWAMGFLCAGMVIVGTVSSARDKIGKVLVWAFTS